MENARILIVEDERIVAKDIENCLKKFGYEVTATIASGLGGIQKVEETHPDLVLMDISLRGDLDGIEAAQQIRDRFNLPVVYLTAFSDETTLERAKITDPFGYILKPFEDRELYTAIEVALARHRAERAIISALDRERELKEIKARFVSMVSHEILNPISAIQASTEFLAQKTQTPADPLQQEHLQRIQSSAQQITEVLDTVKEISQTDVGALEFQAAPLLLEDFCRDQVEMLQLGEGKQHALSFECQGDCQNACMDEKLLWHILNNLLSNAVKYSPEGKPVCLHLHCESPIARFQIQDRGIGIPTEAQPHLFESFYRARNVGDAVGSGLGLTIVKRCVDLHGGQIDFKSEVGAGSTFTVTLPLQS